MGQRVSGSVREAHQITKGYKMYSIKGTTITLTRGDTFIATISLKEGSSTYTPVEGDSVRFALKDPQMNAQKTAWMDDTVLINKEIPIDTMQLKLDPEDTKELDFGQYRYDMEITFSNGDVDTFIENAIFILNPEVA